MLPLLYGNTVYLWVFLGVMVVWCLAEFLGPARRRRNDPAVQRDRGSFAGLLISVLVGMSLYALFPLLPFPFTVIPGNPSALFWIGLGIVFGGIVWRWYSIQTLGKYFTGVVFVHDEQRIVQHGPYRLVRHPSYSGALFATIGLGLMIDNWASLLALVVGLGMALLYRIRVEEDALRQLPTYQEYMRQTPCRLIPYLF